MAARRHMHLYGTSEDHFGIIAVGQRKWAQMSPWAQMKVPMTMDDHHNSRWIAEPLRLLDCCLVSNGAVAVIVTSAERARDLKQPPVQVVGYATCSPGDNLNTTRHPAVETGAKRSGEMAFRMAGITRDDIGTCQLYDCSHLYRACDAGGLRILREGRRPARLSRTASWDLADRFRPIPAAASYPVTTCGPSHLYPRLLCRCVAKAARVRYRATITCWSAAMAAY